MKLGQSSLKQLSEKGHVHVSGTGGKDHLSKSLMSRMAASLDSGSRGKQEVAANSVSLGGQLTYI